MPTHYGKVVESVPDWDVPLGPLLRLQDTIVSGSPSEGRMMSSILTDLGTAILELEGERETLQMYFDEAQVATGAIGTEGLGKAVSLRQVAEEATRAKGSPQNY